MADTSDIPVTNVGPDPVEVFDEDQAYHFAPGQTKVFGREKAVRLAAAASNYGANTLKVAQETGDGGQVTWAYDAPSGFTTDAQ